MGATCVEFSRRKVQETCRKHAPGKAPGMLDAAREVVRPAARAEELGDGVARIELRGEFPLGWCGNLAAGLSRRGVSVVRGTAERDGTGWHAVFEVLCEGGSVKELDLAALACEPSPESEGSVRLESFVLNVPRRSKAVELTVRAPDRTGFLAALLERLALLGLFPERISAETVHGMAVDTLTLHAAGGNAPTERAIDALREFLRGVTGGRSS